jgi:hypothetical protein
MYILTSGCLNGLLVFKNFERPFKMYFVNFELLKSPKLTNDHLEIGNLD